MSSSLGGDVITWGKFHRQSTCIVLAAMSQCCTLVMALVFPSESLTDLEKECAKISKSTFEATSGTSACFANIAKDGRATCTCRLANPDFECLEFRDGKRFKVPMMIKRHAQQFCWYENIDAEDCEIEWQKEVRCVFKERSETCSPEGICLPDRHAMGIRKGILLTPPGINNDATTCYDRYPGFTTCSSRGYCEMTQANLCDLVTLHDQTFYENCSEVEQSLQATLCNSSNQSLDLSSYKTAVQGPTQCGAKAFETIICTPRIRHDGELDCRCHNPYLTMKNNEQSLAADRCDSWKLLKDHSLSVRGWRLENEDEAGTLDHTRHCRIYLVAPSTCKIDWVGLVGGTRYRPEKRPSGPCTSEDKEKIRMIIGKIVVPHGGTGLTCNEVYNNSVECKGLWCAQLCKDSPPASDGLLAQETSQCKAQLTKLVSKLAAEVGLSKCWGCVTRQDDSVCVSAPHDGIRRCKCVLLFNPDYLLKISNERFHNYDGNGMIFGGKLQIEISSNNSLLYKNTTVISLGKRYVAHYGELPDSFFVSYFEAISTTDDQPLIHWSDWQCLGDAHNTQVRQGNILALAGTAGYNAFHQKYSNINCSELVCSQERKNYTECNKPWRIVTRLHKCRCKLEWEREVAKFGHFTCSGDFGGCCNFNGVPPLHGVSEASAYCPVVEGSCLDGEPEAHFNNKDDCVPLSQKYSVCFPFWYLGKNSECPYGTALPGDVTLPKEAKFAEIVCVMYGYVPYLVAVCAIVEFLIRRGTRSLSFVLFVCFIVLMGEVLFKRILMQPRPPFTCLHSCGMPSSHASLSTGYFVIMFVDATWRQFMQTTPQQSRQESWTVVPLLQADADVTARKFLGWVGFWFCLLVPVPLSRVLLQDHTVGQVLVGGAIGLCEALFWFFLMLQFEKRTKDWAYSGEIRYCLRNDLELTSEARTQRFETEFGLPPQFPHT